MVIKLPWGKEKPLQRAICVVVVALATFHCAGLVCAQQAPTDETVQLRVAWGGGSASAWTAELRVSNGSFTGHRSLRIEPRGSGVQRDPQRMLVRSPESVLYEALDITIVSEGDAKLQIQIASSDPSSSAQEIELNVADVALTEHNQALDSQGNRIIVQRSPGDQLQLALDRDHLVFSPGERWGLGVRPVRTPVPPGSPARLLAQIVADGARSAVWQRQFDVPVAAGGSLEAVDRLDVPIPDREGVYELRFQLDHARSTTLFRSATTVRRSVQFVVVNNQARRLSNDTWRNEYEFDAAQPRWWESLSLLPARNRIPGFSRNGPEGDAESYRHRNRLVSRLPASGRQTYPLPIRRPGQPHLLEITCDSQTKQSLAVSVVETDGDRRQFVAGVAAESSAMVSTSEDTIQLLFWPRTKMPYLALENLDIRRPALYGKIRVRSIRQLPPIARSRPPVGSRQALAYFGTPDFPQRFSGRQAVEPLSGRRLTDWNTFVEGSQRLAEYLHYGGYSGAAVGAIMDGGSIFPASSIDPSCRFDTGAYFSNGQDPVQKDALELLLRVFDRERLKLVPVVRLSAAIPKLERQAASEQGEGIRLVDATGRTRKLANGFAVYNPMDARVQAAIGSIMQQLVNRYARHPSFGGICLELGPDTFAQLPSADWGYDGETSSRFRAEMAAEPIADAESPSTAEREQWLGWRAQQVTALYRDLANRITRARPDAKLFLATSGLLSTTPLQGVYQPVLRDKARLPQSMLEMGIDLNELARHDAIQLTRPYNDHRSHPLLRQAASLELAISDETNLEFGKRGMRSAQLLALDQRTYWGIPGQAETLTSMTRVPTDGMGAACRSNLVESLAALDATTLIYGSQHGSTGMSEGRRRQLNIFTRLPAERFTTVEFPNAPEPTLPVLVRQLVRGNQQTVYVTNTAPWPVRVAIKLKSAAGERMRPLCESCPPSDWVRTKEGFEWRFTLQPHDVQAGVISANAAQFLDLQTELPATVGPQLQQRIAALVVRAGQLREPVALQRIGNPSFEPVDPSAEVQASAWQVSTAVSNPSSLNNGPPQPGEVQQTQSARFDSSQARTGQRSMKLNTDGPVVWARSAKFAPPETGRLAVHVWVRTLADQPVPPLRLAIEGRLGDQPYYRYANIKAVETAAASGAPEWRPFVLHVDDLPSMDLEYLQVRFDLMGAGTVWLDDVTLYGLSLTREEHHQLSRMIATADLQLREGRFADCARTLQRFWPRMLFEEFPSERQAPTPEPPSSVSSNEPPERSALDLRRLMPDLRR